MSARDDPGAKRGFWFTIGIMLIVLGCIFIPTVAMTPVGFFMIALGGILLYSAIRGR